MYHHGSFFMPATGRFLKGLMTWLARPEMVRPTAI
jgi:hypothetical protein